MVFFFSLDNNDNNVFLMYFTGDQMLPCPLSHFILFEVLFNSSGVFLRIES